MHFLLHKRFSKPPPKTIFDHLPLLAFVLFDWFTITPKILTFSYGFSLKALPKNYSSTYLHAITSFSSTKKQIPSIKRWACAPKINYLERQHAPPSPTSGESLIDNFTVGQLKNSPPCAHYSLEISEYLPSTMPVLQQFHSYKPFGEFLLATTKKRSFPLHSLPLH